MRYALINSAGIVVNVAVSDGDALPAIDGHTWQASNSAGPGWALSGGTLVPPAPPAPPAPSAADVRAEASRRMQALVSARDADHLALLIANGTREAVRLLRVAVTRAWTDAEAARAAQLQALDEAIEAIRAASNAMEVDPPADYRSPSRWP